MHTTYEAESSSASSRQALVCAHDPAFLADSLKSSTPGEEDEFLLLKFLVGWKQYAVSIPFIRDEIE